MVTKYGNHDFDKDAYLKNRHPCGPKHYPNPQKWVWIVFFRTKRQSFLSKLCDPKPSYDTLEGYTLFLGQPKKGLYRSLPLYHMGLGIILGQKHRVWPKKLCSQTLNPLTIGERSNRFKSKPQLQTDLSQTPEFLVQIILNHIPLVYDLV